MRASGSSLFKSLMRTAVLIVFLCICTFLSLLQTRVFISFLFKALTRTRVLRVFWLPLFFFSTLTRTQVFSNFSFESSSIVFSLIAFMRIDVFSFLSSVAFVFLFSKPLQELQFSVFFFQSSFSKLRYGFLFCSFPRAQIFSNFSLLSSSLVFPLITFMKPPVFSFL